MRYIFPFKEIPTDSRIVIYGATQTGYDFYRQVKSTDYCEIVAWLDRQYEWWREMGLPVDPPESIKCREFDLVVLTAETGRVADSMRADLEKLGVPVSKTFWKDDYSIRENIVKGYDRDRVKKEAEDAIKEPPEKYLNENTLDIVVRVMYAREILSGEVSEKHKDMYRRLMMNQMNGKEPTEDMVPAYFTEYSMKRGWKAFNQSFIELIDSVKKNGFEREYFIPIDSDGSLLNGRHRLAVAVAMGIPVWTRKYLYTGFHRRYDKEWLAELGFSAEEIDEIVKEYQRLKKPN